MSDEKRLPVTDEEAQRRGREAIVPAPVVIGDVISEVVFAQIKHWNNAPIRPEFVGGDLRRLAILGEEFGEVCQALTYDGLNGGTPGIRDLYHELKQTAAMSVSWMQRIRDEHPELFN